MKKFLLILLILLLIACMGGLIWFVWNNPDILNADVPLSAAVSKKKPTNKIGEMKKPETTADILEAIAHEKSQNGDTVGWLEVPGTQISNSVVQSYNNLYYLRRTERKVEDIYGCYFADYECSFGSRGDLSVNTIIYGHSDLKDSADGPKFSQLFKFTDHTYAMNTPYIHFSTLEDQMTWQVFAAFYTDVSMKYINANYSDEELVALTDQAKAKSVYSYNVPINAGDKILTLSTCSVRDGTDGSHRFVVMAKLVPPDEKLAVSADITENQTVQE